MGPVRWLVLILVTTAAALVARLLLSGEGRRRLSQGIDRLALALWLFMILGALLRTVQYLW